MPLEVRIDAGLCMGAGECISSAPSVFRWNSSRTQAEVGSYGPQDADLVREAVERCPNFAISAVETEARA
jgi:ferredoxin